MKCPVVMLLVSLFAVVVCETFQESHHEDEHRMHHFQNSLFNIFERLGNTLNRNQTLTEDSSGNLYMLNIVKSLSMNGPSSSLSNSEQQNLELRLAKLESLAATLQQNQQSLEEQLSGLKSGVSVGEKVHALNPCQSANSSGMVHLKDLNRDVYCEADFLEGGWLVFQQKVDSSLNFNVNWAQYRLGFGTVGRDGNYWLGLEPVHQITSSGDYELAVEFTFGGNKGFARYSQFKLAGEADKYRLLIGDYSGTLGDGLSNRNYAKFSTYDSDNDNYKENCASYWTSAWWFDTCSGESALNYKTPYWYPLGYGTYSRMMIRRKK